jgi:hypothetical protein
MTQEELRIRCIRLYQCASMNDCFDLMDIYSEFLFSVIRNHQMDEVETVPLAEAKLIPQMVFTKLNHLKSIVAGINYTSREGVSLNGIIDPVVVGNNIRSMYELVGMFNLVYRAAAARDEQDILHCLWAHAGLAYRQRFESVIKNEENRKKQEEELVIMQNLVEKIENTDLFKSFDDKNKGKIYTKLKEKDYLIRIQKGEVQFLHWHNLVEVMGIQNNFLDGIYTYFSLYAHPSNVAVFQFAEMFKDDQEGFMELTAFHLRTLFIFVSIFIADYIHLFNNVLITYNQMDIVSQIVINFHNKFARGNEFSINDSYLQLG